MPVKSQIAALAMAASLGAAGGALAVKSSAFTPAHRVHAMDLRVRDLRDGGIEVRAEVWGDVALPDGGWQDLSKGFPYAVEQAAAKALLKDAEASLKE